MVGNIVPKPGEIMGILGEDGDEVFRAVYNYIKEWQPKQGYKSESEYREDLFQFLSSKAEKYPPQKEAGRHLADIGIGNRVGIEVKKDLHSKAEADRLSGQLMNFLSDYKYGVIVVACGKTDLNTLNYVKAQKAKLLAPYTDTGILSSTTERYLGFIEKA